MSGGHLQIDTDMPHIITYPSSQSELCGLCVLILLFQRAFICGSVNHYCWTRPYSGL